MTAPHTEPPRPCPKCGSTASGADGCGTHMCRPGRVTPAGLWTPYTEPESLPKCAKCGGAKETISERTLCGEWVTCGRCKGTGTEPEPLAAWARRTVSTLTTLGWSEIEAIVLDGKPRQPPNLGRVISATEARALLAELDRIAGQLTPSELRRLEGKQWNVGEPWRTDAQLDAKGLLATPLGRALLARKAAQR